MKKIVFVVVTCHLLTLGLLFIQRREVTTQTREPLTVQTIVLHEPPPQPDPKPQLKAQPEPESVPKPEKKPTAQKAPSQKKPDPNKAKLAQLMQESLAALDESSQQATQKSAQRSVQVGKLASETLKFERNYAEDLTVYLEELLELPESGSVKITLTVARSGVVQNVHVTHASTSANRSYIESSLPSIALPPFGKHFKGESAHTFSIKLMSEDSR